MSQQRTIRIKLDLSQEEIVQLQDLSNITAQIFDAHTDWSFKSKTWSKILAHRELYAQIRTKFPNLHSSFIQTTRDVAMETCKRSKLKTKIPVSRKNQSIRYDSRIFRIRGQQLTFSGLNKRVRTIVKFPVWCASVVKSWKCRSMTLKFDDKKKIFFAHFVFSTSSMPANREATENSVVGIDRGIINAVATSRSDVHDSKKLRKNQRRHLFLRKKLQAKGTRSARTLLKRLSGKEKRFSREQNHILTKNLANDTSVSVYVLENLKGIRRQRNSSKRMNKLRSNWSFSQFETFLHYKCEAKGILVAKVPAFQTSQRCSCCGIVDKTNRNGGRYDCKCCGLCLHADVNAAINIRDKWLKTQISLGSNREQGAVNRPDGSRAISGPRERSRAVPV